MRGCNMEIKRKFEIMVATKRRYVIHQTPSNIQIACSECGEPMVSAEQTANLLGIKQRRIFQIIETGAAHFTEAEAGALMICLNSLSANLDGETLRNKHNTAIAD